MDNQLVKYSRIIRAVLWFLLGSCLFFGVYDVIFEKIWWTTYSIYVPCALIFAFGIKAWNSQSARSLQLLGWIFLAIDLFLIAYGAFLLAVGEVLWGVVTIAFSLITGAITYATMITSQKIRNRQI